MNLDDASLLSAYLDDELEPHERLAVESALLADAPLAEQLRQVAAVRSLLSRQERSMPALDLSSAILARIEGSPRARVDRVLKRGPMRTRALWVSTALASAAALMLIVLWNRPAPQHDGARDDADVSVAVRNADVHPPVPEILANPGAGDRLPPPADISTGPVVALGELDEPAATISDDADTRILELLERRELRRVMVVVDRFSSAEIESVKGVIQRTERADPTLGQIRIAQGIEIDPDRPDEAVVFVTVLDGNEFRNLQENLQLSSFEIALDHEALASGIATQLVDLNPINIPPDSRPSMPLGERPDHVGPLGFAHKVEDELRYAAEPDGLEATEASPGTVVANSNMPEPGPSGIPRNDDLDSGAHAVVLVWITARTSDRSPPPL